MDYSGSGNLGGRDYITPKRRQGLYLVYKRYIYCQSYHLFTRTSKPQELGSPKNNVQRGSSVFWLNIFIFVMGCPVGS